MLRDGKVSTAAMVYIVSSLDPYRIIFTLTIALGVVLCEGGQVLEKLALG